MPKPNVDEIIARKHSRGYLQFGGARPNNVPVFYGLDSQYFFIGQSTKPGLGTINPVWVQDPRIPGRYRLVGRTTAPPNLATGDITLLEKHGSVPRQLGVLGCQLNAYELTGKCKDLSSLLSGWDDYVTVHSNGLVQQTTLGQKTSLSDDGQVEDVLNMVWGDHYAVGKLSFGETATVQVDRELVDVAYQSRFQCGDCGPADDGTQRIYAITKSSGAASPGLNAELIYTVDGGATIFQSNITSIGVSEDPLGIDVAGDTLILFSTAGIYWSPINAKTGIPGAFTKTTLGLVAGKTLTDIFVLSPREIFFSALGGYIYKATDISQGVTAINAGAATALDLFRIHGDGNETIIAVGAGTRIIRSVNRGATWGQVVGLPALAIGDVTAVAVLDANRFWIGFGLMNRLYYTLNGGDTWAEKPYTGNGAGSLRDIAVPTDEVIYVLFDDNTPTAYLLTSFDGGASFARNDSGSERILNWPVFTRGNRIAFPDVADATTRVNNVTIAGLAGNATDGIMLIGAVARL